MDIMERLRWVAGPYTDRGLPQEASAEIARLRAALQKIADCSARKLGPHSEATETAMFRDCIEIAERALITD